MPAQTSMFENVFESAPDALIGVDHGGVIRFVNRQAERLFGYDRDELVGQSLEMLVPESSRMAHPAQRAKYRADPTGSRPMGTVLEVTGLRHDGTEFPVDISLSSIDTTSGPMVTAALRDVTERHRSDQALNRLAALIVFSEEGLTGLTLDGTITSWNPAAGRIFGYSSDEIIGKSIRLLHREGAQDGIDVLNTITGGERVDHLETIQVRKDGTQIPVSLSLAPNFDADGTIIGASVVTLEITEQRHAFEAARSMIESSLDSLVSISPEGMITDVNEATVKITGIPREQLIGTAFSECFTEPEKANEIYQRVFAEGMAVDYPLTMCHHDGTHTDVLYNASVQRDTGGKVLGVFAAARDVTRQRQAFEAARSMIESSLDSLVSISPEGMITDANEATVKVTGIPREQLIGTAFSECFTEPEKANAIYQLVFEQGMAVDYPLTMRHRDGMHTDVLYNASVQRDTAGKVLGVFAAARDVTKQRQAQYARSLIEAGLDPLVTISPEGKITDVNEATVKVTGVLREQLIGTEFSDYFTEPDKANEGYQQAFAQGSVTDYPLTMRHLDGALIDVLYNASVYRDSAGNVLGVFAAARDVTEQKQAQAAIAQQAKELDRLAELERFQRLTVGRELKMIELKKEIESLRGLLPEEVGEFGDQI